MTPQPQQEYCIGCGNCTQEGLSSKRPRCKITGWFLDMYDVQKMIATIGCKHDTRSRPHTSSKEAPETFCPILNDKVSKCKSPQAIRNETRKNDCILAKQQMDEERLEFLDMLYSHCNDGCKNEEGFCGICKVSRVIELMTTRKSESLRSAKETSP